jgi:hypothetical protein
MKRQVYNILALSAAILLLSATPANAQELTKDFSKSFTAVSGKTVFLSNRYGDLNIETWDRNEVSVEVKVTVEMSSRERSERLLELIEIEFIESDTAIGAKTIFSDRFSTATRGTSRFRIDYTVKMPSQNNLTVENRYGNIKMGTHPGRVNIDLRYGNLYAMKLTRGNIKPINFISISYGKAAIDEANWLSAVIRYTTDFNLTKVQAMTLDSRYSKIIIDNAGSIVSDSKYDNITVREINNLVLDGAYTSVKLGTLTNSLRLNAKYGSFDATSVPAGFESISVDAAYCGIGLGIERSAKYRLDAKVNYGSLSYCEECIDIQKRIVESNSREISGVAGSDKSPAATVNIKSSYGSVRLR